MFTRGMGGEDTFMRRSALCWPRLTPDFWVLTPLASHSAAASSWLSAFLGKVGGSRWNWMLLLGGGGGDS